jgi:hypothetical protein
LYFNNKNLVLKKKNKKLNNFILTICKQNKLFNCITYNKIISDTYLHFKYFSFFSNEEFFLNKNFIKKYYFIIRNKLYNLFLNDVSVASMDNASTINNFQKDLFVITLNSNENNISNLFISNVNNQNIATIHCNNFNKPNKVSSSLLIYSNFENLLINSMYVFAGNYYIFLRNKKYFISIFTKFTNKNFFSFKKIIKYLNLLNHNVSKIKSLGIVNDFLLNNFLFKANFFILRNKKLFNIKQKKKD